MPTRTPRTGRRPGRPDTRAEILAAARARFAAQGYEGTSLRAVATDAGVDAALVVHYFGTKGNLFIAAVDWPFDPCAEVPRVVGCGRARVGVEMARLFVETWDREGDRNAIITVLRAAITEPAAAAAVREFMTGELFAPLMAAVGSDRPQLRADLVASQLLGLGLARYVLALEPLASTPPDEVVAAVAPTLQRYFTGDLAPAGQDS